MRPRLACFALFPVALLLAAVPASAQDYLWEWTGGPDGGWIQSLAATPSGALLAGPENGGLYRSTDGGLTWEDLGAAILWPCCNYSVPALASGADRVYAGTWGDGVRRSSDDGITWDPCGTIPGDPYPIVMALAVCRYGDRVVAGGNFGVAISEDAGETWSGVNAGLPAGWVKSLALHATTLFAYLQDGGLYRLDPESGSWSAWEEGLSGNLGGQSLRTTDGTVFFSTHQGGAYHLSCSDSAWVARSDGMGDPAVDAVCEVSGRLFAGLMGGGVWRWDPGIRIWTELNDGLWNRDVRQMESALGLPYAGTFGAGVFAFDAGTAAWEQRVRGLHAPLITSLAAEGDVVYAGLEGSGVFVSSDRGQTWTLSVEGMTNIWVFDVELHDGALYAATWNGVQVSGDQGQTWSPAGVQGFGVFALAGFGSELYAGTMHGGVWVTEDGATWTEVGTGLPPNPWVRCIERHGAALYIGTYGGGGIFRLSDGGSTWEAVVDGLPEMNVIALLDHGGSLYAGLENHGVVRWNDTALEWEPAGLDPGTIFCLFEDGGRMLAGMWGALKSTLDGGQTWSDEHVGLKEWLPVRALARGDTDLYAGLGAGGVWRASLPVGIGESGMGLLPEGVLRVHPNPFSAGAGIRFTLEGPRAVRLDVHDVTGSLVRTLVSRELPAGPHEIAWDGTGSAGTRVAAGVYVVRLRLGDRTASAKTLRID